MAPWAQRCHPVTDSGAARLKGSAVTPTVKRQKDSRMAVAVSAARKAGLAAAGLYFGFLVLVAASSIGGPGALAAVLLGTFTVASAVHGVKLRQKAREASATFQRSITEDLMARELDIWTGRDVDVDHVMRARDSLLEFGEYELADRYHALLKELLRNHSSREIPARVRQ